MPFSLYVYYVCICHGTYCICYVCLYQSTCILLLCACPATGCIVMCVSSSLCLYWCNVYMCLSWNRLDDILPWVAYRQQSFGDRQLPLPVGLPVLLQHAVGSDTLCPHVPLLGGHARQRNCTRLWRPWPRPVQQGLCQTWWWWRPWPKSFLVLIWLQSTGPQKTVTVNWTLTWLSWFSKERFYYLLLNCLWLQMHWRLLRIRVSICPSSFINLPFFLFIHLIIVSFFVVGGVCVCVCACACACVCFNDRAMGGEGGGGGGIAICKVQECCF